MTLEAISQQLFTITFFIYVLSIVTHFITIVSKKPIVEKIAFASLVLGLLVHTAGLIVRWVAAGFDHPPMTNIYETMLLFVWGIILITVYFDIRHKISVQNGFALLIALVAMGLAALNPNKEISPLMPALRSLWLHVHVIFAAFSYAFFLLSAIFAFLYIIKSNVSHQYMNSLLNSFSLFCLAVVGGKSTLLLKALEFNKVRLVAGKLVPTKILHEIEHVNVLFFFLAVVLAVSIAVAVAKIRSEKTESDIFSTTLSFASVILYTFLIGWLFQALGSHPDLSLSSNPYRLGILLLGFFALIMKHLLHMKFSSIKTLLPSATQLDQLSYKSILLALPLLTVVIVTGSVWAHYAWGRYWGWDPKETWSLITWFIYAIYLHLRIQKNWQGQKIAFISILGFFAVIFTYLGVNILLSGLHSYG
jgi:cytochrome c-type biogenesis protein CcsB